MASRGLLVLMIPLLLLALAVSRIVSEAKQIVPTPQTIEQYIAEKCQGTFPDEKLVTKYCVEPLLPFGPGINYSGKRLAIAAALAAQGSAVEAEPTMIKEIFLSRVADQERGRGLYLFRDGISGLGRFAYKTIDLPNTNATSVAEKFKTEFLDFYDQCDKYTYVTPSIKEASSNYGKALHVVQEMIKYVAE